MQLYSNVRGRLTSDANDHYNPSMNNRGDVVWEQYDPGTGSSQIYGIINGVPAQITAGPAMHIQPSIGNTGEVVWSQGSIGSNNNIYSSTRGQLTFGCPSGFGHNEPSVNSCGDLTFTSYDPMNGQVIYRLGNSSPCVVGPEPNNTLPEATVIAGNSTTTGMLDATSDRDDWYSFTANAGDEIKITVNWSPSIAPNWLELSLTDMGGMVLVTAPEAGSPKTVTTTAPVSGTYHVHLTALSGGRIGYNLSVKVKDITPPTVSIYPVTAPTNVDTHTIEGNREAGAAIAVSVNTAALVGSVTYPTATTWSCPITGLVEGSNIITVTATDAASNKATVSATITYDSMPPLINISQVTTPTKMNTQAITGSREEDAVVAISVNTAALVGSVTYPTATSWSCPITGLVEGANIVTAIATDVADNSAAITATITYDSLAPTVGINPVATPTNVNSQTIAGSREADAIVAISVNTAAAVGSVTYPTTTSWSCPISGLVEGANIITVSATDAASNSATVNATMTYDSILPVVSIRPVSTPTNMNSQTISGGREADAVIMVSVTGASAGPVTYPSTTTWSCTMSGLVEGGNAITVSANDAAGNSSTIGTNIFYDSIAPTVAISSPIPGQTINNKQILIYTIFDGTVTVKVDGLIVNKVSGSTLDLLANGPHTVRVEARDAAGNTGFAEVNFMVNYTPLVVGSTSLAWGVTGAAYTQNLAANGGVPPYTWSIQQGTLPQGLSLDAATGVLSGIPAAVGPSTFLVQVQDSNQTPAARSLTVTVYTPLAVTTTALANGFVNAAYSQTVAAEGGLALYTWSVTEGSLPAGLYLNPSSGEITGNPASARSSNFTVQAQDANLSTATRSLSITISAAKPDLVITALSGPTSGTKGNKITVTTTVKNQGQVSAGSSTLTFYLSLDSTITTGDIKLGDKNINTLSAGSTQNVNVQVTIPSATAAGTYFIGAIADRAGVVAETNEVNNTRTGNTIAVK